ncbi:MAG TPA: hypothetical protein VK633_08075 [Verrucomicrobiae bacterium]|nr:hypothetical protein [Verrucomicrobiae bacterium]
MKWPNHTDYQDALQNPAICFEEPELKQGEAACDLLGLPRVMSGNFASVYELAAADKRWAIRCFVRQVSGTQARYARLAQYLRSVTLPWLVDFEFILRGILVQGDWYPIVKMEWVEGCPLNTYVEQHLDCPEKLIALAEQFRTLVADLRREKIAHGDFQHGNIMVTPTGEMRLVDYDGMFCPAFGRGRSPELGHVNFQHPARSPEYYDESLDNFAVLVIYSSLLALAAERHLWSEFNTGDNLIFLGGDFRAPQNSRLFEALGKSPNREVRLLAAVLRQSCAEPIAEVPWLEETVVALQDGTFEKAMSSQTFGASATSPGAAWWNTSQTNTTFKTRSSEPEPATAVAMAEKPVAILPATPGCEEINRTPPIPPRKTEPAPAPPLQRILVTSPASSEAEGKEPIAVRTYIRYDPLASNEPGESTLGFKLKFAFLLVLVVGIFWYGIAAAKARSATDKPPADEPAETR